MSKCPPLGDPQRVEQPQHLEQPEHLEQPQNGSHPDGAERSALGFFSTSDANARLRQLQ